MARTPLSLESFCETTPVKSSAYLQHHFQYPEPEHGAVTLAQSSSSNFQNVDPSQAPFGPVLGSGAADYPCTSSFNSSMDLQFPSTPLFSHPPIPFIHCMQPNFAPSTPLLPPVNELTASVITPSTSSYVSDMNQSPLPHLTKQINSDTSLKLNSEANVSNITTIEPVLYPSTVYFNPTSSLNQSQVSNSIHGEGQISVHPSNKENITATCTSINKKLKECEENRTNQCSNDNLVEKKIKKRYTCNVCDKVLSSAWGFKTHLRCHAAEKPFSCKFCTYSCVTSSALIKHTRKHTGEKPHHCDQCFKSFKTKHSLRLHIKIHTGEKPYECNICGKKFIQKAAMNYHIEQHNDCSLKKSRQKCESLVQCPICLKEFTSASSLLLHYGKFHPLQNINTEHPTQIKNQNFNVEFENNEPVHNCIEHRSLMKCDECHIVCDTRNELLDHYLIHSNQENVVFTCHICQVQFEYYCDRELHIPTHFIECSAPPQFSLDFIEEFEEVKVISKENPNEKKLFSKIINNPSSLLCKICHKESANYRCLKIHMKIHEKKTVLKCAECPSEFWHKSNFTKHMDDHKRLGEIHNCNRCCKVFHSDVKKWKHIAKCGNAQCDVPYECPDCGHSTLTLRALIGHVNLVHSVNRSDEHQRNILRNSANIALCPKSNLSLKKESSSISDLDLKGLQITTASDPNFRCSVCDRIFLCIEQFQTHWINYCSVVSDDAVVCLSVLPNKKHLFVCSWCSHSFATSSALLEHEIEGHLQTKSTVFSCRTCFKLFISANCCLEHYRTTHAEQWGNSSPHYVSRKVLASFADESTRESTETADLRVSDEDNRSNDSAVIYSVYSCNSYDDEKGMQSNNDNYLIAEWIVTFSEESFSYTFIENTLPISPCNSILKFCGKQKLWKLRA